jgi:hypothetical protein
MCRGTFIPLSYLRHTEDILDSYTGFPVYAATSRRNSGINSHLRVRPRDGSVPVFLRLYLCLLHDHIHHLPADPYYLFQACFTSSYYACELLSVK